MVLLLIVVWAVMLLLLLPLVLPLPSVLLLLLLLLLQPNTLMREGSRGEWQEGRQRGWSLTPKEQQPVWREGEEA